jgi:hypothetical protein
MNVLDLFSGIGGLAIGLERAGMRTVAFCEREPYCQAVLRSRWPGVPVYDDICELTAERLAADGISVDQSQEDSHAKTSAMLVMALELKENDPGSGLSTRASLAHYDPSFVDRGERRSVA